MKELTRQELKEILVDHVKWLNNDGGCRADLSGANLRSADLSGANLRSADLSGANLRSADLSGADLRSANLRSADLSGAELSGTNLSSADLMSANLRSSNLSSADLSGADLMSANLRSAELSSAKSNEKTAFFALQCPEEGAFIAWKKCKGTVIVKLLIPEDAKRSSATSRKCRASKATVLEIYDINGSTLEKAVSSYDKDFLYTKGETVEVSSFNENRWDECSNGIHFFITRQEAENYN